MLFLSGLLSSCRGSSNDEKKGLEFQKGEATGLQNQITELENTINDKNNDIAEFEREIAELKLKLEAGLSDAANEAKLENSQMIEHIKDLENQVANLKSNGSSLQETVGKLTETINKLEKEKILATNSNVSNDERFNNLLKKYEDLEKQNSAQIANIRNLNNMAENAQIEKKNSIIQAANTKSELAKKESEERKLKEEIAKLKNEGIKYREEINKLKSELQKNSGDEKNKLAAPENQKLNAEIQLLNKELQKIKQKYRDLLGQASGGTSSSNSVKDEIVRGFREITNEYTVSFWQAACAFVPEKKQEDLFQLITELTFFEWSSNSAFSSFVWKPDVSDEERENNIKYFKNTEMSKYIDKFKTHMKEGLKEFSIDWTNNDVKDSLNILAPAIISLQFEMRIAVPRIKFLVPNVGNVFNPRDHKTCSNHGELKVTKCKQPGLVNAFDGHPFIVAEVETFYKEKK
jgi:chromosome segregation ATPase